MPSTILHSPYETLAFLDSIAKHGLDASVFPDVSKALIKNEFIHQNDDVDRFSAEKLRAAFEELMQADRARAHATVNGDVDGERSPKRRKLSASSSQDDMQSVMNLSNRLYATYREDMVKSIRRDEEAYARLQDEIRTLEQAAEAQSKSGQDLVPSSSSQTTMPGKDEESQISASLSGNSRSSATISQPSVNKKQQDSETMQQSQKLQSVSIPPTTNDTKQARKSPVALQGAPTQLPGPQRKGSQQPVGSPAHQSPNSFNRTLPLPSPGRPNYGPIQNQHGFSMGSPAPPGQAMPNVSNIHQRPSPVPQTSNQGRGSPIPTQAQHQYPAYQQYPHQQWHPHIPPQQFQQHPGYGPPPSFYPQPIPGRHPSQTPQQSPYPYPPPGAVQQMTPQGWRPQQWPSYPASGASTPMSRPASRMSTPRSGNSTPWKKKRESSNLRLRSPTRPEREVSPLTDTDSPAPESTIRKPNKEAVISSKKTENETPGQQTRNTRRGRPPSKTPSAIGVSRSQSIASHTSDTTANEKPNIANHTRSIKAEPPSTPLPQPSDPEQQQHSSGRRGRPRKNTLATLPDLNRTNTVKRKRDTVSPTPSIQTLAAPSLSRNTASITHDPSLVVVSKNFAKTAQLLLNDITSHKLAGIFAKPLSERDAPGYKDLVLRAQDLKGVKTAISKGGKAALSAIESLEAENGDIEAMAAGASGTLVGSIRNGFYLVKKTEDLVPPKGVVNSAQLEMELVRMFANAVMFNPLPSSERGFGRSLRPRKMGGDLDKGKPADKDEESESNSERETSSEEASSSLGGGQGWDEGGIIMDAREMFEDVVAAVSKWRGLEVERMTANVTNSSNLATPSTSALLGDPSTTARQASVSAASVTGDDRGRDQSSTPVPSGTGGPRKRRRIAANTAAEQ